MTPSGRLLVLDEDAVYGFGRQPQYYEWTIPSNYRVFKAARDPEIIPEGEQKSVGKKHANRFAVQWELPANLHARALVKAGDLLCLAGTPIVHD
jgi:hypothetical protein